MAWGLGHSHRDTAVLCAILFVDKSSPHLTEVFGKCEMMSETSNSSNIISVEEE